MADDHFSPTYLRAATAYGFLARLRGDLVVNNLVGYALLQGAVLLKSDGTPWRPLVHIQDIARAYLAILEGPKKLVHDAAFNVGRIGENYQIRDVAKLVATAVPTTRVEFAEGAGPDRRCYQVDFSKLARTLPAFKPSWTVADGVRELAQAYTKYELTAEAFLGPRHQRVKQIAEYQESGRLTDDMRWTDVSAAPKTAAVSVDNPEHHPVRSR